ncbi:hypothetical protein FQN50_009967 [Emmonsiellopsis sp. PD_5]|nr:hypothetical protein FQN50_009967 [Emmonsiellopsis sp. PD_5]
MLGKRKREVAVVTREIEKDDNEQITPDEAQEILRRHFESRFAPLDVPKKPIVAAAEEEEEEDLSDVGSTGEEWDGLSDGDESEQSAEVVEHTTSWGTGMDIFDKQARKAFMTAKPPSSSSDITKRPKPNPSKNESPAEIATDAEHLKNDLALQRLLKESHLLESADDLNPTGSKRHRALDLRMQSIGAKDSLYTQAKMPMTHRKGIISKATRKEDTRRREARENGIILEKPTISAKDKGKKQARRERGIGGPSVGKFAGGTLRLSKKDVAEIQGPRKKGGAGRGRGGKGRGGGRGRK